MASETTRGGEADAEARGRRGDAALHQAQREPAAGEAAAHGEDRRNPGVPGGLPERETVHVHQVLRGPVGPEEVAHHAEGVGGDEDPQAAVAQHGGVGGAAAATARARRRARRATQMPQRNPGEAEHAGDDERVTPAVAHRDPGGQRRRERSSPG